MNWRKCSEEMPIPGVEVLAFCRKRWFGKTQVILAAWFPGKWKKKDSAPKGLWYQNEKLEDSFYYQVHGQVTHWMPLPDFPGEEVRP